MGVHESQSLLWERMVALSEPFMHYLLPRIQEAFPGSNFEGKTPADLCVCVCGYIYIYMFIVFGHVKSYGYWLFLYTTLLFSCSMLSGALQSPLLSYSMIQITSWAAHHHHQLIIITIPKSFNAQIWRHQHSPKSVIYTRGSRWSYIYNARYPTIWDRKGID